MSDGSRVLGIKELGLSDKQPVMSVSPTPIRWDEIQRVRGVHSPAEKPSSVSSRADSWGVIAQDGSRREASSSYEAVGWQTALGRPETSAEPSSESSSEEAPSVSPRSTSLSNLKEEKSRFRPGTDISSQLSLTPGSFRTVPPAPHRESGGSRLRDLGSNRVQSPEPYSDRNSEENDSPEPAVSLKGQVSAAELVASVRQENLSRSEEKRSVASRRTVEMPSARPTLEEQATDTETLLENLVLETEESKPVRAAGIDRRRPFDPAPIDLPVASQPSIPIAAREGAAEPSRSSFSSAAMSRGNLDPELSRVMDAWPTMPKRTREAILAMIDISLGKR